MHKLKHFTFNNFGENTWVLSDESGSCIIIDPGCYRKVEQQELKDYILSENLQVEKIVNTHCHIDHVLGNAFAKREFGAPLLIPEGEKSVLEAVPVYAQPWGFPAYEHTGPDGFLPNEGELTFGQTILQILYVPGHSPGHLAFYHQAGGFCINGDVLFRGSIGRTDLPGGNHQQLLNSIAQTMFALPDDTVVYCGHGPETSIGFEKQHNPFLAGS